MRCTIAALFTLTALMASFTESHAQTPSSASQANTSSFEDRWKLDDRYRLADVQYATRMRFKIGVATFLPEFSRNELPFTNTNGAIQRDDGKITIALPSNISFSTEASILHGTDGMKIRGNGRNIMAYEFGDGEDFRIMKFDSGMGWALGLHKRITW